jgi:hypothetical protein
VVTTVRVMARFIHTIVRNVQDIGAG